MECTEHDLPFGSPAHARRYPICENHYRDRSRTARLHQAAVHEKVALIVDDWMAGRRSAVDAIAAVATEHGRTPPKAIP